MMLVKTKPNHNDNNNHSTNSKLEKDNKVNTIDFDLKCKVNSDFWRSLLSSLENYLPEKDAKMTIAAFQNDLKK